MANPEYDYALRMVVVGDSAVGKSSLILRFTDGKFSPTYVSTIGVDFRVKSVVMRNDRVCKIVVWDTAGQERFRNIVSNYYRGSGAALIAYDVTRRSTFENVRGWIDEINRYNPRLLRDAVLCCNKMDTLPDEHRVTRAEGESLAKEHGLLFFETSAKDDGVDVVHDMFVAVAERATSRYLEDINRDKATLPESASVRLDGTGAAVSAYRCCVLL